ncbi:MAG: SCP2 sterol-binding domain-containing protein [Gemmatimonadales bacterium]|nr:SCP2 sterol-binding domain-containing protein [Gemmatimonadales bacterium]
MIAFSEQWASAWCAALNSSEAYQAAAAAWEGSVAVVARNGKNLPSAVYLDLHRGQCRAARSASEADLASAAFVLEGDGAAWRDLFTGRQAPLMALMSGRIKLARGEIAQLVPHAGSARELVTLAGQIPTEFPDDW